MVMKQQPVILKKISEEGLSKESLWFPNYHALDQYLGRGAGYISGIINSSNRRPLARDVEGNYYGVVMAKGKKLLTDDDIQKLYNRRFNGKVYKTKHLTKTQKIQKKIKHLKVNEVLRSIDEKYGSIDAAEGTPEIAQLRKLLNA